MKGTNIPVEEPNEEEHKKLLNMSNNTISTLFNDSKFTCAGLYEIPTHQKLCDPPLTKTKKCRILFYKNMRVEELFLNF